MLIAISSKSVQACREPQRGRGKHFSGAPKHFLGAPLGRKFLIFLEWCVLVYFIFLRDGGPPNVAGLGVANSLYPTLSTGLSLCLSAPVFTLNW